MPRLKNVIIALFVLLCIGAWISSEMKEAKDHSQGDYLKYEQEQLESMNEADRQREITDLYDESIIYEDAWDFVGEKKTVMGEIADIYTSDESNGRPIFIDIGNAYPDTNRVTAVIWEENRNALQSTVDALNIGDTVFIYGYLDVYDGIIKIEVTEPSQIKTL